MILFAQIIVVIVFILIVAAVILLQIHLSKKESKWPGLILPIISFLNALFVVLSLATYHSSVSTEVNGIEGSVSVVAESTAGMNLFVAMAAVFVVSNIPTMILLVIYSFNRKHRQSKIQLDKMTIQDLE